MAEEREIKVLLKIPLEGFIEKIIEFGFKPVAAVNQTDTYFDTEDWNLYKSVAAIRIRAINGIKKELTYKKLFHMPHRANQWFVEEVEAEFPLTVSTEMCEALRQIGVADIPITIDTAADASALLSRNNLFGTQVMDKTRRVFLHDEAELVIDDIQGMAPVIEIEGRSSDPLDLLNRLLTDQEWERSLDGTSYVWLEQNFGLTHHKTHQGLFKQQADWNVLLSERAWYDKLNQPIS